MIILCDYGCGMEAIHQFKNGKWCCSKNQSGCPVVKNKKIKKLVGNIPWNKGVTKENSIGMRKNSESIKKAWKNPNAKFKTDKFKEKRSRANSGKNNPMYGKKHPNRITIKKVEKRYPFFSKIEKLRYNPDKPNEKEIQVHCKNHNCKNSQEKGGWFTPTRIQITERIRQLESFDGNDGSYFYCSKKCKNECPLFNLKGDPYKNTDQQYTESEYQIFRKFVLERDNYICQYCGEKAEHVHHERPQKLEPFFALDPDFAWNCCKSCHYEKGHPKDTNCSTGKLSSMRCNK